MPSNEHAVECISSNMPKCPHCKRWDQDWYDGLEPKDDGDTWEADCPFCEKPYSVHMSVSTTFTTAEPVSKETE